MKNILKYLSVAGALLLVTGCSSPAAAPVKKPVSASPPAQQPEKDWGGEWVFLSDDALGHMTIQTEKNGTFKYQVGATSINPSNGSSYANGTSGTGTISGSKAILKSENESCNATLIMENDILAFKFDSGSCNTEAIVLDGHYKKIEKTGSVQPFQDKDGDFYLHGIKQGMSPAEVKAIYGNPEYEGPMEDGGPIEFSLTQRYGTLYIGYGENKKVHSVYNEYPEKEFSQSIQSYTRDIYQSIPDEEQPANNKTYFYNEGSEQLFMYSPHIEKPGIISARLVQADPNFYDSLNGGAFNKIEK